MHRMNHKCLLCSESSVPACNRACSPMQSGTDGRVGGWVLSAHRSSCGSVVPLLFTTQARRACQTCSMETYQGWMLLCASILMLTLHYLPHSAENMHRGDGSLLGGGVKIGEEQGEELCP